MVVRQVQVRDAPRTESVVATSGEPNKTRTLNFLVRVFSLPPASFAFLIYVDLFLSRNAMRYWQSQQHSIATSQCTETYKHIPL